MAQLHYQELYIRIQWSQICQHLSQLITLRPRTSVCRIKLSYLLDTHTVAIMIMQRLKEIRRALQAALLGEEMDRVHSSSLVSVELLIAHPPVVLPVGWLIGPWPTVEVDDDLIQ